MSWEADSQLVRGTSRDHNLAIGDPRFLRKALEGLYSDRTMYPTKYPEPIFELGYPDIKPMPFLAGQLRELHPDKYVVITNGAKQALHAAIRCSMKSATSYVWHRTPYWPSHPSAAQLNGRVFCTSPVPDANDIIVNTSPNNPDGTENLDPCDIWDASYAHPVYGWSGKAPPHKVSVWSAGKLLGTSGLRLGWLVTEDKALAERATRFVEQTTSGVSMASQHHVAVTLANVRYYGAPAYKAARKILEKNTAEFNGLLPYIDTVEGFPMNGKGMFAWFKVRDPELFAAALKKAEVLLVDGSACGATEQGWYRMSLGQGEFAHECGIHAIQRVLKNGP